MSFLLRLMMAVLLLPVPVFAQTNSATRATDDTSAMLADAANHKKKTEGLFGSIALGYLANSGNTESTSLNAKLALGYLAQRWRHAASVKAIQGSNDGETTAKQYDLHGQSDYTLGKHNYVFVALSYVTDQFGAYRRRASETAGYGRRLIETEEHMLDVQVGVGARQTRPAGGSAQEETIVTAAGKYEWRISDHSNLSQRIAVEDGPDNTYSESASAITANVGGNLALSLSYTVKHNSQVPSEREKTDSATAVSLLYEF